MHGAPPFREQFKFLDGDVGPVGGLTWDGRAESLAAQARIPLFAANEMANANEAEVVRKLRGAAYASLFRQAFGERIFEDPPRAFAAAMSALQAFQQEPEEFFPYSSRYDAFLKRRHRAHRTGGAGAEIFKDPDKGNCASCHLGTSRDGQPPPFTDFDFVNVGAPRNPRLAANADPAHYDLGLCGRAGPFGQARAVRLFPLPDPAQQAIRDTFFHNGAFGTLRQVIEFYNERDLYPEKFYSKQSGRQRASVRRHAAGIPDNIDHDPPLDRKPGSTPALSAADIDDLIAFLKILTDKDASP